MRRVGTGLGFAIAMALPTMGLSADLRPAARPVEGQYIVVLKQDQARLANERSSLPEVVTVAVDISARYNVQYVRHFEHVLHGFGVRSMHTMKSAI